MARQFIFIGMAILGLEFTAYSQTTSPTSKLAEVHEEGLMVKRSAILKTEPVADLGVARYWAVEKKKDVMCLFVEVSGTVPMHYHPDGIHRMYMVEGKMRCTIGNETMMMEPGDYMMIPRGVRHKLERVGEGNAYFVTVDGPPINPKNNVWLEPPPRKK
jgi:quercetin dioxygenase-like cupin family protein